MLWEPISIHWMCYGVACFYSYFDILNFVSHIKSLGDWAAKNWSVWLLWYSNSLNQACETGGPQTGCVTCKPRPSQLQKCKKCHDKSWYVTWRDRVLTLVLNHSTFHSFICRTFLQNSGESYRVIVCWQLHQCISDVLREPQLLPSAWILSWIPYYQSAFLI